MGHTVGEVAKLAGVSVRTLHHYDKIGLLAPSERSEAGYRLYGDDDLVALQQVLFFRELGFSLDEISRIMHDPSFDRVAALQMQRRMLEDKASQLLNMMDAVDRAIEGTRKGVMMDKEEMFEVFGEFDPSEYEDEVKERWGDTDAYKESTRRTKSYTKEDWKRIKAADDANMTAMVELFDAGVSPDDERAMDVAEEARLQIDRNYYPCTREMHVYLGQMYVADPRFTAYYDRHREGLAQWFRDAIKANAAR